MRSDHANLFITQLEWLKIKRNVIFDVAVNALKITPKLFPDWFLQFLTNNDISQNRYITRHQHTLYVYHTNTDHDAR